MPDDRFVLRIPVQKLLVGLCVTLLPICLFGLYAIHSSDKAMEQTFGSHFRSLSEGVASEVSLAVHDMVRSAGVLAVEPSVLETVRRSNRSWAGMSDSAIADRIGSIDLAWNTPAGQSTVSATVESATAQFLREYRERDPRLLRITVTDEKGATVAASHKTLDYFQADEDYWQSIYAGGRGAISLTDILYDDVTKSHYVGIGIPILETGTGRFLGTVDVLADVGATFAALSRVRPGDTGRAMLVKEDGVVIAGSSVNLAAKAASDEWATLLDRIGGVPTGSGHLVADLRTGGRTVIGYADTGLKRDYAKLSAYVVVAQTAKEAFAPLRGTTRLIAFMSLLGIAMVTLLAMFFALHRQQRIEHIAQTAESASS